MRSCDAYFLLLYVLCDERTHKNKIKISRVKVPNSFSLESKMKNKINDKMNHGNTALPEEVQQHFSEGRCTRTNAVTENKTFSAAASH